MNTNKISLLAILLFAIIKTGTIKAQIGQLNIKKDGLKGPVCLYKKTVQKDFKEKFGKYKPEYNRIKDWYIYDKEGRKLFSQKIDDDHKNDFYKREIYFYEKGKLKNKARAVVQISDNSIADDGYHIYYFYNYLPNNTIEECIPLKDGKKYVELTEKFDAKNNLIERSKYMTKN